MKQNLLSEASKSILDNAVVQELTASNMYKQLANQCQKIGLFGASKFFLNESVDELKHYQIHIDYVNNRGNVIDVPLVNKQISKVITLKDALLVAYRAEYDLGELYNKWYMQVLSKDVPTALHLLKYVQIQCDSIGEYGDWLARLELVKDDTCGMLIIDKELGDA